MCNNGGGGANHYSQYVEQSSQHLRSATIGSSGGGIGMVAEVTKKLSPRTLRHLWKFGDEAVIADCSPNSGAVHQSAASVQMDALSLSGVPHAYDKKKKGKKKGLFGGFKKSKKGIGHGDGHGHRHGHVTVSDRVGVSLPAGSGPKCSGASAALASSSHRAQSALMSASTLSGVGTNPSRVSPRKSKGSGHVGSSASMYEISGLTKSVHL